MQWTTLSSVFWFCCSWFSSQNLFAIFSSFCLYLSPPLSVSLSLSIGISHWASRTERCLFLASCWLHPPERLSCFVEMQDTWLELAWQRCRGRCASSITTPLLHSGKWWWPKKAQRFHLKVPWAVIWIITSSQPTCYFDCFYMLCKHQSRHVSLPNSQMWLVIFKVANLSLSPAFRSLFPLPSPRGQDLAWQPPLCARRAPRVRTLPTCS